MFILNIIFDFQYFITEFKVLKIISKNHFPVQCSVPMAEKKIGKFTFESSELTDGRYTFGATHALVLKQN